MVMQGSASFVDKLNQLIHDRIQKDNPGAFDVCTAKEKEDYDASNKAIYHFYIQILNSIMFNMNDHWHYNPKGDKNSDKILHQMYQEISEYEGNILLYLVTYIKLR